MTEKDNIGLMIDVLVSSLEERKLEFPRDEQAFIQTMQGIRKNYSHMIHTMCENSGMPPKKYIEQLYDGLDKIMLTYFP